jgi:transcriptional regulator with XRE-family HTH domain
MTETKPTPNQKLRYERERRAWSQQETADKVGTTPLNVSRWERGQYADVEAESLLQLALLARQEWLRHGCRFLPVFP